MGVRGGWLAWMVPAIVLLTSGAAWAAEAGAGGGGGASIGFISIITGGFAMAIASAAAAVSQGRAIASALDAIGRQPNAAPRIQVAMIIGLALIESLAIYVLLISLIIFFVKPFGA